MEYLKSLVKNRKLTFQLGKNDFRNRFASTSLGAIWGFAQPFVFMLTYVIVFQYILKTGSSGKYPYVVWFLPGMTMWMFLNDSIMNASSSIRSYSYLVKKVVFPVDIIPTISLVSSTFIGLFLFAISTIMCMIFGYFPNVLEYIYIVICFFAFVIALTRFTSAITTVVPDFGQLLTVIMQIGMWLTPIMWNLNMLSNYPMISKVVRCLPFAYLVTGFREVFIDGSIITDNNCIYSIVFWIIVTVIFLWGNYVFKKNKKDFADVL